MSERYHPMLNIAALALKVEAARREFTAWRVAQPAYDLTEKLRGNEAKVYPLCEHVRRVEERGDVRHEFARRVKGG